MIEQLVKDMMEWKQIIPVCSYEDCHKVRLNDIWYDAKYKEEYKFYTHTYCPDCIERYENDD